MYLDANLMFSNEQSITATCVSKTIIIGDNADSETSNSKPNLSNIFSGAPMHPFVQVSELFEGLISLEVKIQSADEIDSEENWKSIATSGSYTQEKLNTERVIHFGSLPSSCSKYIRLQYLVEGSPTKGKLNGALVLDSQS